MRLLTLIPPQPRSLPASWFLREERHAAKDNTPMPPYMAPSILGMVRSRFPEIELPVMDCMVGDPAPGEIRQQVHALKPDLVLAILAANHLSEAEERQCAELPYPTITIVTPAGADPREYVPLYGLNSRYFVHTDEVETAVAEGLREWLQSGDIRRTPGFVVRENGGLHFTGPMPHTDMSAYPLPAFDLFPQERYRALQDQVTFHRPQYAASALINTMKGCPFTCAFCVVGAPESKPRVKNADQIVGEIRVLHDRFGWRRFVFMDSEFAAKTRVAKDVCRGIIASDLRVSFDIKNRIEMWDDEYLALLKQAGCEAIHYGIETADPKLQKVITKHLDLDRARKAIAATKAHGIKVHLYMMMGIPGEDRESLALNAQFVADTKPDGIAWGFLFPEVGSPLHARLRDEKKLTVADWAEYRRFDRLTFKHDTYRNIDDLRKAELWMMCRYRKALSYDPALPARSRLAYFLYSLLGSMYYVCWDTINRYPSLAGFKDRLKHRFLRGVRRALPGHAEPL
ncbi:MAG: radical SAM protein [Nitrospirae bacterium]|nr:radical SAM protein [Nitrospirota bacterium]